MCLIPILPKIDVFYGRTALSVAADKLNAIPISQSLKWRGLETAKRLLSDAEKRKRMTVKRSRKMTCLEQYEIYT